MDIKKTLCTASVVIGLFSISAYADFQASFNAGRAAAKEKKYDVALGKYQEAINLTKNVGQRYQVLTAMAAIYQEKQDWSNAEGKLNEILKDESISAQHRAAAQVTLGDYKLKQKKVDEAIAEYKKVPSFNVRSNDTRYALLSCGSLLLQQKKYDEAQACFQQLIDDQEADAIRKMRAQIGMGTVLYSQGKYQDAIAITKAASENTKLPATFRADALIQIARSQYKMKHYKECVETNLSSIGMEGIPA